ncbi:MAG: hypothetical protein ACRD37_06185, partial [Candidatus Acidiferrales bacterium]
VIPGSVMLAILMILIWRVSRPNKGEKIKPWSRFLMVFVALLFSLVGWTQGSPRDIGGALARTTGMLLFPFLIAYAVRGRKNKRDWNSFARWFFWLALILGSGIAINLQHAR